MRIFRRAADLMGSEKELARLLRVPVPLVIAWISGAELPPRGQFVEAVDVIIDFGNWEVDAQIFKPADRTGSDPFRFLSKAEYLQLSLAQRRDFVRRLLDHVRDFNKRSLI